MKPNQLPPEATAWAPGWLQDGLGVPPPNAGDLVSAPEFVLTKERYIAGYSEISEYVKPLSRTNIRGDDPVEGEPRHGTSG